MDEIQHHYIMAEAVWHVDDQNIPAQVVQLQHSQIQAAIRAHKEPYPPAINAEVLYGILRSCLIRNVVIGYSIPAFLAVEFESEWEAVEYYRIDSVELSKFLENYCKQSDPADKVNWAREGF